MAQLVDRKTGDQRVAVLETHQSQCCVLEQDTLSAAKLQL